MPPKEDTARFAKLTYNAGDLVWARVKGYPWWPAKILAEDNIPPLLNSKQRPANGYAVIFYGTIDYLFITPEHLRPFKEFEAEFSKLVKKKDHKLALEQIRNDPTCVDMDLTKDVGLIQKPVVVNLEKKKRRRTEGDFEDVLEIPIESKKRKRQTVDLGKVSKKAVGEALEAEDKSPVDKLMTLRHKLQKIFLSGDIRYHEFGRVNQIMTEIEQFPVSFELLKETKIGKVIKKISQMKLEPEPEHILSRCEVLLEKWRQVLMESYNAQEDANASSSAAEQSQAEDSSAEKVNEVKPTVEEEQKDSMDQYLAEEPVNEQEAKEDHISVEEKNTNEQHEKENLEENPQQKRSQNEGEEKKEKILLEVEEVVKEEVVVQEIVTTTTTVTEIPIVE